jgi:RNA ligase (TIGR02306 family)
MNDAVIEDLQCDRALASVRRIDRVVPHPDADLLDLAIIGGWQCVTQKSNNFKEGDLVCYFEIDSFLPIEDQWEWLRKSSYRKMGGREGFRIKTIKLRKELSQGLIMPLEEIGFIYDHSDAKWYSSPEHAASVLEGDDLTSYLGVVKWDPPLPACLGGVARGNFPTFIKRTDQSRVQNLSRYLDFHSEREFEVTLKLDGSSCTVYSCPDDVVPRQGVCSRNLDLVETDGNSFWQIVRQTQLLEAMHHVGGTYAIQGELMGPGIQKNPENLPALALYVFDVYAIDTCRYLNPHERRDYLAQLMEQGATVDEAPVIISATTLKPYGSIAGLLAHAAAIPSINNKIAEGAVWKSCSGDRFSFKVISNKYLLKEKD